jgi:diguanylate cyclase (GGDEF)-like protein
VITVVRASPLRTQALDTLDGSHLQRRLPLDRWLSIVDDPSTDHRYVLRLTYGITPVVVAISALARALGMRLPLGLAVLLGTIMLAATWRQDQLVRRGAYRSWMPAVHLNLALLLLAVWEGFSGGVHSPFVWVFAVACAVYGMLWGMRWALVSATLSCLYVLGGAELAAWFGVGVIPAAYDVAPARAVLASYAAMFYLLGVVSAFLRQQVQEISRLALTDGLTGLGNRRALKQALDRDLARGGRLGQKVSVLVVELDGFKIINDLLGHLRGDEVLREVGVMLRQSCRATDALTRYGGDEFVIVLPQAGAGEAMTIAERIRTAIHSLVFEEGVTISSSIGLATYPDDALTVGELLDTADRAMYLVKSRGGNRIGLAS